MQNLKAILEAFEKHDIYVHELDDVITSSSPYDTHYLMQGAEIIHKGNLKTIEAFALRLK